MTQTQLQQINECAKMLSKTIEKFSGAERCLVQWAFIEENGKDQEAVTAGSVVNGMDEIDIANANLELTAALWRLTQSGNPCDNIL